MMGSWTQQLLLVMAGGALGAAGRFWLGGALLRQFGSGIPWGTLAANLLGSFAVGFRSPRTRKPSWARLWRAVSVGQKSQVEQWSVITRFSSSGMVLS